ncbi:MFS transporter [Nonomuraea sp. KC401]|uniref:MFS transporter n=1 Tax=unclassified Nonomuraea TaxID=2593643 RepID=UPI0010FE52B8|nr:MULTISPECIES: MFS transporter [unclassified Nonomuraea]NBE91939.1 MFS transporter [Nonomuraea sp. K271]TLF71798.1 MFS transporter [Nonomuraea sp. KC401]
MPVPARRWGVLIVLCGAIFLEGIDVAMLNVALPAIRADLGVSTGMLSGVVSAYVLGYGGFMLLGGRAADLLGRRRMFLLWLGVFLAFSGLGGVANDGWVLLLARFVTGVAAGFMTPAGLSLITTSFPEGRDRNRALIIYGSTGAAGFALGLVFGGVLTEFGWRWVFFAPVLMSLAILLTAIVLIKEPPAGERPAGGFDLAGAASVTGAMMLLVYGVVRLEHPAEGLPLTLAVFAVAAGLLAAFAAIERRSPHPLVRLRIFRSAALVRANVTAVLLTASFFGFQFLVTLYLQELRGWSPMQTGLALLVAAADVVIAPTLTPRLVNRYGNAKVILGGLLAGLLAYALFLGAGLDWTYAAMVPSMALLALMFAFAYGPLMITATDGIASAEQGLAGGLINSSFQFGAALGVSMVTAVNVAALGDATTQVAGMAALRTALTVPVTTALLASAIAATALMSRRPGGTPGNAGQVKTTEHGQDDARHGEQPVSLHDRP